MPKPLVFVPGFPASELVQPSHGHRVIFPPPLLDLLEPARKAEILALLVGPDEPPDELVAGEPIRAVLRLGRLEIGKRAQALYDLLRRRYGYTVHSGDNFRAVGWDWRQAVDAARVQGELRRRIVELAEASGGGVVVLVHSTGGLVLRRLLEAEPALAARIEQILALGVPWAGAVANVYAMAVGQTLGFGPASFSASEVRQVMRRAQAAYDLFPPDPARTDMRDPSGEPLDLFVAARTVGGRRTQLAPLRDLSWVPQGAGFDFMRAMAADADRRLGARASELRLPDGRPTPPITNVVGWGVETVSTSVMDEQGKLSFERSQLGDGTCPSRSGAWLRGPAERFRTVFVPVGIYPTNQIPLYHALIWDSPPLAQIFDEVLADTPRAPYVCGSADKDQAIDPRSDVTLRLVAADPHGRPLPRARCAIRGASQQPQPFGNRVRLEVVVPQAALRLDAQRIVRLVVEVAWGAGGEDERREVVVLFKR